MTSISNLGIGAGIDTASLLDQLSQAEQAPLDALKTREQSFSTKLSAYGTLQGLLANLQTAAKALTDPNTVGAYTASSSAPATVGATAATSAVAGSYAVNVTQLAAAQSLLSGAVADPAASLSAGAANITIDFGSLTGTLDATTQTYQSGAAFVKDAGQKSITVSLAAGQVTLNGVRDAINAAASGAVTASIASDGTKSHLVLTSNATGQKSSMNVAVDNTDLAAVIGEDFETSPSTPTQNMQVTCAAADAALSVNGMNVTSASNTVAGAAQGVTLTLAAKGSATVSVQRDTGSVTSAVNAFVSAYNRLNAMTKQLTAYDASSQSGGVLLGDTTVRLIQSRMRATLTAAHACLQAGDPTMLSKIGVGFQKDGSLAVDSAKLAGALTSGADGVARLLGGTAAAPGVMASFSNMIDDFNSDQGVLHLAQTGMQKSIASIQKDEAQMQDRIDQTIAVYRQQFQTLDTVMAGLKATSNYLTAQLSSLSTSSSSSK